MRRGGALTVESSQRSSLNAVLACDVNDYVDMRHRFRLRLDVHIFEKFKIESRSKHQSQRYVCTLLHSMPRGKHSCTGGQRRTAYCRCGFQLCGHPDRLSKQFELHARNCEECLTSALPDYARTRTFHDGAIRTTGWNPTATMQTTVLTGPEHRVVSTVVPAASTPKKTKRVKSGKKNSGKR